MRTSPILSMAASATILAAIFSAAAGAQQQSSELRFRPASEETVEDPEPSASRAASSLPRQHSERPPTARHKISTRPVAVSPKPASGREAEVRKELRDRVNAGLVGGVVLATEAEKPALFGVSDFFGSLEQDDSLRVFQIPGKGSSQNILALGLARGLDAAIIQSDVLDSIRHKPPYPDIENYLQYVATLYHKQVHVLASSDVSSIDDLKGD